MLIERRSREEANEPLKVEGITLLSIEEYEATKEYVPLVYGWWWLRSPGNYSDSAAYVNYGDRVDAIGCYVSSPYGVVRPALKISNFKSLDLQSEDRIIGFAGHTWTVIPGNMVLCDTGVGTHCFRKDWQAPDANDYEKSDVKKWLEDWAKEKGVIDAV